MTVNLAQVLIAVIGTGASITTFCLMRFPQYRRAPSRHYGAFSVTTSLIGAGIILALCALMVIAQGIWQPR